MICPKWAPWLSHAAMGPGAFDGFDVAGDRKLRCDGQIACHSRICVLCDAHHEHLFGLKNFIHPTLRNPGYETDGARLWRRSDCLSLKAIWQFISPHQIRTKPPHSYILLPSDSRTRRLLKPGR